MSRTEWFKKHKRKIIAAACVFLALCLMPVFALCLAMGVNGYVWLSTQDSVAELDGFAEEETYDCILVLGAGVRVMKGATVCDSVILENVVIESGADVECAIIDSGTVIGADARIGEAGAGSGNIAVVGADISVPAGAVIAAGAMISNEADINKGGN